MAATDFLSEEYFICINIIPVYNSEMMSITSRVSQKVYSLFA